jgi:hypothetical protein
MNKKSGRHVSRLASPYRRGWGWSLWPIRFALKAKTAAMRRRKMSRLQPARRPSLPMNIQRPVEGGGGEGGDRGDWFGGRQSGVVIQGDSSRVREESISYSVNCTQPERLLFRDTSAPDTSASGSAVHVSRARCSFRMQRSITTKIPAWRAFSAAFSWITSSCIQIAGTFN